MTKRKVSVAEGVRFQALAERERVGANLNQGRDPVGAHFQRADAAVMQAKADEALADPREVEVGNGGELVSRETSWNARPWIHDTLTEAPDYLRAQAAIDRLQHAPDGTLTVAVEAATSIDAKNSLERMLCYQLASTHHTSQRLAKLSDQFAAQAERELNFGGSLPKAQAATLEASRCAHAQARAAEAFQKGMLTLDRIRNGGKQHVMVQHVNVQDGGQAVVAGTVGRDRAGGGKADEQ